LLAAQWGDGRVPHIVFNPEVPAGAYFPGPGFWRSSTDGRGAGAPEAVFHLKRAITAINKVRSG
ncbi:hypothetical protein ACFWEF_01945, partial [Bacillus velezensis]